MNRKKTIVISTIIILALIVVASVVIMNKHQANIGEKVKGGEGCGMFDNATRIEVTYNESKYSISDTDEVQQIIKLCRTSSWESSDDSVSKDDCDLLIEFIGARSNILADTQTLSAYIAEETHVKMPEDLLQLVMELSINKK